MFNEKNFQNICCKNFLCWIFLSFSFQHFLQYYRHAVHLNLASPSSWCVKFLIDGTKQILKKKLVCITSYYQRPLWKKQRWKVDSIYVMNRTGSYLYDQVICFLLNLNFFHQAWAYCAHHWRRSILSFKMLVCGKRSYNSNFLALSYVLLDDFLCLPEIIHVSLLHILERWYCWNSVFREAFS